MNLRQFKIIAKQTFGYKQRTLITFISIVSAVSLLMLAQGFIEWMIWATQEAYVWNEISHIQVQKKGYRDNFNQSPNQFLITRPPAEEIQKLDPEILAVIGELIGGALISYNDQIIAAQVIGTEIETHKIAWGKLGTAPLAHGNSAKPGEAVMGIDLMKMLDVKTHEQIILLSNTVNRSQNAIELPVGDYFQTSNQALDMTTLKIPLEKMQNLLKTDKVHQWAIYIRDTDHTDSVLEKINNYLKFNHPDYEAHHWIEVADFYSKTRDLFYTQLGTLVSLMTCIMFLGLLNIFAINILNRRKEIATAKAVGYNNKQIFVQFFTEGITWGLVGGISGLLIGLMLCQIVSYIGIPMPPAPGMSFGFTAHIHLTPQIIFKSFLVVFFTTVLANILPAIRAARTNVVYAFGTKLT